MSYFRKPFKSPLTLEGISRVLNTADTNMEALFLEHSIDTTHIDLEEISVSDIWNVRTVRYQVDCRSHVFSSLEKRNFSNGSTDIISRRKTFSRIFIAFSESGQNFVHFEKKDQLYSSNITQISDSGKCCYLDAGKLLFQNTLRESTCSRVLNTADTTMSWKKSLLVRS